MNITLEQVEEPAHRTDLSYEEAKAALEASGGSLLDALIALEQAGRLTGGQSGTYSTRSGGEGQTRSTQTKAEPADAEHPVGRFFRRLGDILNPSSQNQFEIWRQGELVTDMPILILVILMALFFWIALPLLIVGLFLGFRYQFSGPDLGRKDLNSAMDKVSDTVDSVKAEFSDKK